MQNDKHSLKAKAAYRLMRINILTTQFMPSVSHKLSAQFTAYVVGWMLPREVLWQRKSSAC